MVFSSVTHEKSNKKIHKKVLDQTKITRYNAWYKNTKEQTKESEQKCFLPGLLFFYAKKEEHHEIKSQGTGKTDASYGR